ncbi:uncharacterized protein LOC119390875 [Rhipicephalus sanguineus]|uniref:uncharacterized protein LOC119390875 n=1 Tax=Rhipicephalus sanguineus TaxID=34632 RepID=UPI0020C41B00|nr:uncharacterized protein LOC119390875 [Rhipicephalus sanguineus]
MRTKLAISPEPLPKKRSMASTLCVTFTIIVAAYANIKDCEVDSRHSIIYATDFARAVNHFMTVCMKHFMTLAVRPNVTQVKEVLDAGCIIITDCIKKLQVNDTQIIMDCAKPLFIHYLKQRPELADYTEPSMAAVVSASTCTSNAGYRN